jgi:hypothetical protein
MLSYRTNPRMEGAVCLGMNCILVGAAAGELRVGQLLEPSIAF